MSSKTNRIKGLVPIESCRPDQIARAAKIAEDAGYKLTGIVLGEQDRLLMGKRYTDPQQSEGAPIAEMAIVEITGSD